MPERPLHSAAASTVAIVSLGCAKNTVDSDSMAQLLTGAGYELVTDPRRAGVLIVNTCGFIETAKEESRTTLAELAAIGRPAVIVPLPTATDDHQRRNARVLVEAGAAVMIEQHELTGERLVTTVATLLADPGRRATMAAAMRTFARPDAAAAITRRVLELAR